MLQTAFRPSCMNRGSVFSGIRDLRKAGSLWGMMRGVGGVRKSLLQSWLAKGLGLGLLCWGFKGVQEEIQEEFRKRWASRQFLTNPIVKTLLPVNFGSFLSSEAVVMRQLSRWKRLWRRSLIRSHKKTSMGPSRSCSNGTTSALQYIDDIKSFVKNKREIETQIQNVSICSQNIGIENSKEKFSTMEIKSRKRHITEGMEQSNREKSLNSPRKGNLKILENIGISTIEQVEMKKKIEKEYLRRNRRLQGDKTIYQEP